MDVLFATEQKFYKVTKGQSAHCLNSTLNTVLPERYSVIIPLFFLYSGHEEDVSGCLDPARKTATELLENYKKEFRILHEVLIYKWIRS
jgi:hypothetical protein